MRQLLDHAGEFGYGVPAFNVNNLEQIHAIMEAAQETDSPVILQASAGARKYAGEAYLRHMVLAAAETHPDIPIVLHQDHGSSPAVCQASIRSGFTSVMMDGSLREDMKTPSDYDYNVEVTRRVCEMAHAVGVSVEGELGCLGSLETGQAGEEDGVGAAGTLSHDMMLTDPAQARDFVARTGDIKETYGVPVEEILRGIRMGVRKVNIDTDIRLAMTGAIRKSLSEDRSEFDPRKALQAAKKGAKGVVKLRFEAFGCAGQASRIKPVGMEKMAGLYR
ncbi:Fructose-bisphosphate aldolase [compost metagenome]